PVTLYKCRRSDPLPRGGVTCLAGGQLCPSAAIFLGAPMVHSVARFDFSNRVRVALGPDRRTNRFERNHARRAVSSGCARATWRPRGVDLADAVLAQLERCVPSFFVRWRRCLVSAAHFWNLSVALPP